VAERCGGATKVAAHKWLSDFASSTLARDEYTPSRALNASGNRHKRLHMPPAQPAQAPACACLTST
jgi:hypothetical protein